MATWYLLYERKESGRTDFELMLHPLRAATETMARAEADTLWSQLVGAAMRHWAVRMQIDREHAGQPLARGPRHPRLLCEPDGSFRTTLSGPTSS